jgi:hypothetical protein
MNACALAYTGTSWSRFCQAEYFLFILNPGHPFGSYFKNGHFPFLIALFHIFAHQQRSPWNKSIDNTYGTLLHFTRRKTMPYPMKNFFPQAHMGPAGL